MAEQGSTPATHPSPKAWWFHRRLMAYLSLVGLLGLGVVVLAADVDAGAIPLLQSIAWALAVIVLAYFGGNAAEAFAGSVRRK